MQVVDGARLLLRIRLAVALAVEQQALAAGGITNALGLPIADEQSSLNRMYPTMVKA